MSRKHKISRGKLRRELNAKGFESPYFKQLTGIETEGLTHEEVKQKLSDRLALLRRQLQEAREENERLRKELARKGKDNG